MPNRIIKESICTSDTLDQLTPEEEVFFYRLLVQCDDYGCMDARLPILLARCYPLRLATVTVEDVSRWLQALVRVGLVRLYQADGKPYLYLPTWDSHQQIRAKRRKFPEPPADDKDVSAPASNGNQVISDASTCARNPIQSESKVCDADAPPPPKPPTPQQAMFEAICEVCVLDPATVAKGRVGKRASTLVKAGYTPEQVRACYGKAGWWYQHDWRGRKGDPPKPEQIGETIKQAVGTDPPSERPSVRIVPQQGNHWWEESA